MSKPYNEIKNGATLIRYFDPAVDDMELVWHRDMKDRHVTIVKNGGWKFQREDELPIDLFDGEVIFIPKETWHRVLKGNSILIVEIFES